MNKLSPKQLKHRVFLTMFSVSALCGPSHGLLAADNTLLAPMTESFSKDVCSLYSNETGFTDPHTKALFTKKAYENFHGIRTSSNAVWILADVGAFMVTGFVYHYATRNAGGAPAPGAVAPVVVAAGTTFLQSMKAFTGYLVSPFLVANLVSDRLRKRFDDFYGFARSSVFAGKEESTKHSFIGFEQLRLQFECRRTSMPVSMVKYFDEVFDAASRYFFTENLEERTSSTDQIKKFETAITSALSLPLETKRFTVTADLSAKLKTILKEYDDLLKNEMVKKTIELSINSQRGNSKDDSKKNLGKKPTIYLLGEPGTGKTTLARKYAETLGLLLVEIPMGKEMDQGSSSSRYYGSNSILDKLLAYDKPSLLTSAIMKARRQYPHIPFSNMVFFIDEADKVLNSSGMFSSGNAEELTRQLLKMLDPDTNSFMLDDLGIEFDISSSLFILAGNKPLKNQALASRMKTLVFPPFALDKKLTIVTKQFQELAEGYNVAVTDKEIEFVKHMVSKDPNSGVRAILLTIGDYVNFLKLKENKIEHFDWLSGDEEFDFRKSLSSFSNGKEIPRDEQDEKPRNENKSDEDDEDDEPFLVNVALKLADRLKNPKAFDALEDEKILSSMEGEETQNAFSLIAADTVKLLQYHQQHGKLSARPVVQDTNDDAEQAKEQAYKLTEKLIQILKDPIAFNKTLSDDALRIQETEGFASLATAFAKGLYEKMDAIAIKSNTTLATITESTSPKPKS